MYEIYKTRAIIFSKKKFLEKSKNIIIFSKEFGFISTTAHGIFLEKSKNKSILQSGNLIDIYLVKGKNSWIISGGVVFDNIFFSFGKEAFESLYLNLEIIKKYTISEVAQKDIFDFIENNYFNNKEKINNIFLNSNKNKEIDEFNLNNTEKILEYLGYWEKNKENNFEKRVKIINNTLQRI